MAYRLRFHDAALDDLQNVPAGRARSLLRAALERLEREGPCIGVRLRGDGRRRFCRISVPEHARNTWRVIYQWPPEPGDPADVIAVWVVREEADDTETNVYHQLDVLLEREGVEVGPWSAGDRRLRCCEDAPA